MYKTLDMPVKWFHKIIETNNMEYLYDTKPKFSHAKRIRKTSSRALVKVWENLNAQLIAEFGVTDEFKRIFYKQKDINDLEVKALMGDTSAPFLIEVYKSDLALIKSSLAKVDNYKKYHAQLHRSIQVKWPGRNTHELSVYEFYNDVADLMKESEEREMQIVRDGTNG